MIDKSKWLWALPNTGKELQLTDSTVISREIKKNGKAVIEYFSVTWGKDELKKSKQVPNSPTFAGYANIGYIVLVDAPKEKASSEKKVIKAVKAKEAKKDET